MKVFVTGATGFIGSHVVRLLQNEGHHIVGLCRTEEQAKTLHTLGIEAVVGDVKNPEGLEKTARECDAVLHLAFIHDFSNYNQSCLIDIEVVKAFQRATQNTKKPVVITSGSLVLGASTPGQSLDDTIDIKTIDLPDAAIRGKVEIEALKANFIVCRLSPFVYGHDNGWFSKLAISLAKKHGYAAYIGDGNIKLSAVHVEDCARAYVAALTKGKPGKAYNIVGETVSYKELAEAVGKLVKVEAKSISMEEAPKYFDPFFTWVFSTNHEISCSQAHKDLEWKPTNTPGILEDIGNGTFTA